MEKLLFPLFAIFAFLSSCTISRTPFYQEGSFVDYNRFLEEGIFITESNSAPFNYIPVGSISSTSYSGYEEVDTVVSYSKDDIYETTLQEKKDHKYRIASPSDCLEMLVRFAKAKNADAIINLRIESFVFPSDGKSHIGFTVNGMAVKRED